jgi:RimJ/RimL family protein N-acetyltransferase
MSVLVLRALEEGEFALFDRLPDPGLVGFAAFDEPFAIKSRQDAYRPEWVWVALRGPEVVARAAWWGGPDDVEPRTLDWFDFTEFDAAVRLLNTAPFHAKYELRLPPGWREDPATHAAATIRIDAARAAGMTPLVERYRYRWTPSCGIPKRPGRLEFRPEPDDAAFLELIRQVNRGSLDAHVRATVADAGFDAAARQELDDLRWLPSPRSWWLTAYDHADRLVGFVVPAHHHADPLIAYVGVVPEHRGKGYAHDLLVEATHRLVEHGVDRIVAGTDVTNTPMAAAFTRAGYPVEQHRLDLVHP